MMRWFVSVLALIVLAAWPLRADVAPFPSWSVAANGLISGVVQAGSTIYVAGAFTKVGPSFARATALFDPATLAFTPVAGCARRGEAPFVMSIGPLPTGPAAEPLVDANGPFQPAPGTALVRVGPDCRFDRRFQAILPAGVQVYPQFGGTIVETGGRVYFQASIGATGPIFLVEVDGVTGRLRRYWPADSPSRYRLRGGLPGGRLLVTSGDFFNPDGLGWVDPADGASLHLRRTLTRNDSVRVVGAVVVLGTAAGSGEQVVALDAMTLAPLPSWPVVQTTGSALVEVGEGRLFLAASSTTVNGVATSRVLAFDAVSGAHQPGFATPSWLDDSRGWVSALSAAGGRLVAFGEFAPGAPRDSAAAFDAVTGALDPWTVPHELASGGFVLGDRLRLFPFVATRDRIARTNLAAVDARTGQVLPWTAVSEPVSALAVDAGGGFLYAASPGRVRRYDLTTGAVDALWTFDVSDASGGARTVTGLAIGLGRVYAVGDFTQARDGAAAPWQPREAGAAMTVGGALAPWRPRLRPGCSQLGRPLPFPQACVAALRISQDRVFLQGQLVPDDLSAPVRSLMAVTADTGAVDPVLPFVPPGMVRVIDDGPAELFADALIGDTRYLASFNTLAGARLLSPVDPNAGLTLAVFRGRLYFDVERDAVQGWPTENPVAWRRPAPVTDGIADIDGARVSWYALMAERAPAAPLAPGAEVTGATVTLRWSPAAVDLAPYLAPPPIAGTAATSHVVLASLTAGGEPVAEFETVSPDTAVSLLLPPGTYFLRVQARNAFGTSLPSAQVRVDVSPTPPAAPAFTVAWVWGRTVQISWQRPATGWPADGYRLDVGSRPGATDIGSLPVPDAVFAADGVPPGRYYVRVRAVNGSGVSAPGNEVIIDVP